MRFWLNKKSHYNDIDREEFTVKYDTNDKNHLSGDIKVVLFPDRIEIEKLNIKIPYSSLGHTSRGIIIGRIIQEISKATGLAENEILLVKFN